MTTPLLTDDEVDAQLRGSAWVRQGNEIVRDYKLDNFTDAISLVNRIAQAAEERNHHPDILVHGWNNVRLSLTNHAAGGLTAVDLEMAEQFDALI